VEARAWWLSVPAPPFGSPDVRLLQLVAVALLFVNVGRLHEIVVRYTGELPIAKVLLAVGAMAVVSVAPWDRLRTAWRARPAKALALFTSALLLSLPFSYYRAGTLTLIIQFCLAVLPIVGITVAAIRNLTDLERLFRATALMVATTAGLLLAGIGVTGETRLSLVGSYDPNDLALVLATCLPFCVWCLRDRSVLWQGVGLVGLLGGLYAIVKTGSRGGFVAVAMQFLVLLVVARQAIPGWLRLSVVPALVLVVAFAPGAYRARLQSLTSLSSDYNTTELSGRQAIWTRGATYFLKRPLTGIGAGQFSVAEGRWGEEQGYVRGWQWSAPHSMYVEAAAELGLLGIGSLLAILASILQYTRRSAGIGLLQGPPDPQRATVGVALFAATLTFAVGAAFLTAAFKPVFMMLISYAIAFEAIPAAHARTPMVRTGGGRPRPLPQRGGLGSSMRPGTRGGVRGPLPGAAATRARWSGRQLPGRS